MGHNLQVFLALGHFMVHTQTIYQEVDMNTLKSHNTRASRGVMKKSHNTLLMKGCYEI